MIDGYVIALFAFAYIGALFCVAYFGDRFRAGAGPPKARPTLYALTLAIYCTSWTFLGSVGFAAASGLDFVAVYVGPILAFLLAGPLLRRIVRLTKAHNITSIADFIAARYGKNAAVAAVVTVVAILGLLPYLSLQLKAISESIATLLGHPSPGADPAATLSAGRLEFFIALVLAAFAILFGARHSDATEHQRGLMLAVAVESAVKLAAFLSVGAFIAFAMFGGFGHLFAKAATHPEIPNLFRGGLHGGTLLTVAFLSFVCVILLPRQFHVTFVENVSEAELNRASWLFPAYLAAINIFVVPVALAGLITFRHGSVNPDMFLLALPMQAGSHVFTLIAFAGGLSAATAMVVVETVALSIMVSNEVVMPLLLRQGAADGVERSRGMSEFLLYVRRTTIVAIVLLACGFHGMLEGVPLASIGLLSFAAIAQLAPAFFGGLFFKRATARGALAGICAGFAVWAYTLLLPYLVKANIIGAGILEHGPFGIALLRPEMLFYLNFEPLTHGVVWSLFFNCVAFAAVSLLRPPQPIERLQANVFIETPVPIYPVPSFRPWRGSVTMADLVATVSGYLGTERTERSFAEYANARGVALDGRLQADIHAIRFTENLLASAIGAASSRLVMSLALRRQNVGANSALKLLDDASEAIQYNRAFLQTALERVRQGLAVFDKDMRLICWNRQFREILSLPPQLVCFGTPLDHILRFSAQRTASGAAQVEMLVTDRVTKYVVSMESFHERLEDGRVVEVQTDAMPQGGIVVTYMDITESVKASEALAVAKQHLERRVEERTAQLTAVNRELAIAKSKADEANLGKTRFLAAASHDILQPLNAARLYATSLMERGPPLEFVRLARNIDASLEAVEEILNALLDISRLDTGALKPEISTFPMNELFERLRVDFEPVAKTRGLSLTILPSVAVVRSDRRLMRRILQNLLSNALKYTSKGGVVLGCRKRGRKLLVQVHDTGPGIPDHQRALIFKEFHRLDQKGDGAPGLGLGLSIVERMCRVLGHSLALDSRTGRGSTFTIVLPLARETERRPFIMRPASYGDLRGTVVVCLDDEREILDGMRALLSGWQCIVLTAAGSTDALQQLRAAKVTPAIIVSDYHLEKEDGVEATRAIASAARAAIPAIIITADRSPLIEARVDAAGLALLRKPVKPAALRALMSQLILKREAAE